MVNPVTVAFAGGGRDIYVGSLGNGALVQLHRDPRSGRLAKIAGAPHCWGAQLGCRRPPGEQQMPAGIAVPGDERHVYVTGADNLREEDALGVAGYARDARSGALTPLAQGVVCPRPASAAGGCAAPRGGIADSDRRRHPRRPLPLRRERAGDRRLPRATPASGALTQLDGAAGCLLTNSRHRPSATSICAAARPRARSGSCATSRSAPTAASSTPPPRPTTAAAAG